MKFNLAFFLWLLLAAACSTTVPHRDLSSIHEADIVDFESMAIDDDGDDKNLEKADAVKEGLLARWFNKKVGLFNNSDKVIAFDLLKVAKKTIDIEIYEMKDPTFRDLLVKALKRGVKVRIVKDSRTVADTCDELSEPSEQDKPVCAEEKAYVKTLLGLGAKYVYFNKQKLCAEEGKVGCYQHGKMIITDNKYLLLSSGNFNSSSFCNLSIKPKPSNCNRDYSYVTKNKKVIEFLKSVLEKDISGDRWNMKSDIANGHPAVTVSPYLRPRLVSLIRSAKKSITVQNQYLEEPEVNQALVDKAQEGVEVKVMVSDFCNFGKPAASKKKKSQEIYSQFDTAGIQTRVFMPSMKINDRAGYLHSKAIVIDKKIAWIGSTNGSVGSMTKNREFGIIFKTKKAVRKLLGIMDNDFSHPKALTWERSLACEKVAP